MNTENLSPGTVSNSHLSWFSIRTLPQFGLVLLLSAASISYADQASGGANLTHDPNNVNQQGQQQGQTPPPASVPRQAPAASVPQQVPMQLPEPNIQLQDRIEQPLLPPGSGLDSFGPRRPGLDVLKRTTLTPPLRRTDSGAENAIERSPAAGVIGAGNVDLQAIQETADALREIDGVQRVDPMEDNLLGRGSENRIPGQNLPGQDPDLLGSPDIQGMPSLGLPDNRSTRPSSWIGTTQSPRDAAGGIAGQDSGRMPDQEGQVNADQIARRHVGRGSTRETITTDTGSTITTFRSADGSKTAHIFRNGQGDATQVQAVTEGGAGMRPVESRWTRTPEGTVRYSTAEGGGTLRVRGVIRGGFSDSHTQDTYSGAGSGVNPLTGQSTTQPKQHPDQVNPDRTGLAESLEGVYIRAGDELVINPDPTVHQQTRNPNPEELQRRIREQEGPGGIPQPPGAGPGEGGAP